MVGGFLVVSISKRVSNHILSIERVPTFSSKDGPRLSRLSVGRGCEHEEGELVSAGAQYTWAARGTAVAMAGQKTSTKSGEKRPTKKGSEWEI